MKRALLNLVMLCLLFVSADSLQAQVTPSGDSYVNTADPTTNYGSGGLLNVNGAQEITFIQFDLASLPASANISQATLKLYVSSVTTSGSFNVDYANGDWTESTITYKDSPAIGSSITSNVSVGTEDKNQYILVDITPAVQAWLNGSQANNGIALVANGSFGATFDSKENTTTSHPAELDIAFAGDGTITGVTTAGGSGLSGGGTSGTLNLSLTNGCAVSQVLQWNGSAWACSSTGTGTLTGVTAGTGLSGGGSSGAVTLNNSGVLSVTAGSGISSTGGQTPTISVNSSVPLLSNSNAFSAAQTINAPSSSVGLTVDSSGGLGDPQVEIVQNNTTDYARLRFTDSGSTNMWDIAGFTSSGSSSPQLNFWNGATNTNVLQLFPTSVQTNVPFNANGSSNTFTNNVAIGTSTVSSYAPLLVSGSATNATGVQTVTSNTSTSGNSFAAFTTQANGVTAEFYSDGIGTGPLNGTPSAIYGTYSNNPLAFITNNTPQMVIEANGQVGIGTTSPVPYAGDGPQLQVNGTVGAEDPDASAYAIAANGFNAPAGSGENGQPAISAQGGSGDPESSSSYGSDGIDSHGGVGSGSNGTDGSGGAFWGGNNTSGGDGILAYAGSSGYAGIFQGTVNVEGDLTKSSGSFKIDDPLDPANKYLYHSFVESPDMMNIYNGNITTDASGTATVNMPEWFEALNRDFRYQLTVIGSFAQAIVGEELNNGHFVIRTDKPNVKVSWQITGIRQDPWANAHRIPVEQEKEAKLKGFYIHPELYGAPPEKQIEWARHPQMMKRMQEMQAHRNAPPAEKKPSNATGLVPAPAVVATKSQR